MKKIITIGITGLVLLFISGHIHAQNSQPFSVITPFRLTVTYAKTTNLIFPYAIQSVDRGSRDLLVQKAKGVDNILEVKAGKRGFEETNLTVITADGKLYSFLVNYLDTPSVYNIRFTGLKSADVADLSTGLPNQAELTIVSAQVAGEKEKLCAVRDKRFGMKLQLQGIYILHGIFYYQFELSNGTAIDYDVEQFRFFIRDKKIIKRTAEQELPLTPVNAYGDTARITAHTAQILVFALPKFTIPEQKYLEIQVMEKNGGRNLALKISNRELTESKSL